MAVGGGGAAVVVTANAVAAGALAVGELPAGAGGWLTAESQATSTRNSSRTVSKRSRVDICRNMDSILITDISVETNKRWYTESMRGWLTRWMAQTAATLNTSLAYQEVLFI